jgi:hypothetical protein
MLRPMEKCVKFWRLLPLTLALLLAVSPGCGGKTTQPSTPSPSTPDGQSPVDNGAGQTSRNLLSTSMPALAGLGAGAEFDFVISVKCTDALYQGSGRVLYDPSLMQPVAAVRGAAIPQSFLFSAKLDAAPVASDGMAGLPTMAGVAPYAFTGLPDAPGQASGVGELCRLRFRLLRQASANDAVRLLNNAEYLQLRGPAGNRLAFDLQAEVMPR